MYYLSINLLQKSIIFNILSNKLIYKRYLLKIINIIFIIDLKSTMFIIICFCSLSTLKFKKKNNLITKSSSSNVSCEEN